MSKRADFLKPKDKVAIVSTARKVLLQEIMPMKRMLESWKLEVVVGKSINTNAMYQLADTDANRAADFQTFIDAEDISAIFFARGGYGSVRIIDRIDFSNFLKHPKWLIGYSDASVFLAHLYFKYNYQAIHGTMSINILDTTPMNAPSIKSLRQCIFGESVQIKWKSNILNRTGNCEAEVVCGNLSVLYSLLGSESFGSLEGKILMLEDLDEYLYHIDRMMFALRRCGKLKNLAALVVGSFSDMKDNQIAWGMQVNEIIYDIVKDYDYPLCFNFPFGHTGENNIAIINGANAKLDITSDRCCFQQ